jgi:hypothetical protein
MLTTGGSVVMYQSIHDGIFESALFQVAGFAVGFFIIEQWDHRHSLLLTLVCENTL